MALVDLTEQVDLERLGADLRAAGIGKLGRRDRVIDALETVARRQQAALADRIEGLQATGEVGLVRPVAIVNRIVVEATAPGILALAGSDEVARVQPEWTSRRSAVSRTGSTASPTPALGERFDSWAIEALRVEPLWSQGLDGRGVVVAAVDSGAYAEHEQLHGRMAGNGRGWFDPVEGRPEPYDSHGHGTSVLGLAVGGNPDGRRIGIAPGATWAAALGNFRNVYSRARMTLAADWILRVARPDVLVNAWSNDHDGCASFDLPFINAWKAAEIVVVFPAGNAGPGEASGESPAQLTGVYPGGAPVFAVAGLDPTLQPYRESSRGPSRCGSPRFPSLAAPGAELPFAFPGGPDRYGVGAGTSLAAGLVAGAAALLVQAEPGLSADEIEAALVAGARDIAPRGEDPSTGAGRLDLTLALEAARAIAARNGGSR